MQGNDLLTGKLLVKAIERVRKRVVVVVVVVVVLRGLFFLVMSVICLQIRGCWSEVTTTRDRFCSDFHLQLHSYLSGFVVLFPCHLSCKHETYWHSA